MSTPSDFPFNFPVVLTDDGAQPTPPATINSQIAAAALAQAPGYTSNLPGSLVEDVLSTDTAAVALIDQYRIETINSLTPFGANEFTLQQQAQFYGLTLGTPTNTSVFVVFSGTVGYVVNKGFQVGDGTNVYQTDIQTVIGGGGSSAAVLAIALSTASFSVPANTVTQLVTSVPSAVTLSVNNPNPGSPAVGAETYYAFRARVLQAGLAACVGTSRFIKTFVGNVPGVPGNLISVQQVSGVGGLRVCVGGSGDEYAVANAIFQSIDNPSSLQGSAVSSGRNVTVSLIDYPDTYSILYVAAPVQTVTMTVTWNTYLSSFSGGGAFPALVQQPLVDYIVALAVGQPINVFVMNDIFQAAVEDVLDSAFLTRLVFAVSINGTPTSPSSGTGLIAGDAESSFTAVTSGITVTQG